MKNTLLLSLFLFLYLPVFAYTGEVLTSFDTPGSYPTGLCSDGKNIWIADRGTDKLYCIKPETGKVIREIESPAYWPMGLAWDGEYLWNADYRGRSDKSEDRDGMIFKIDPKDGTILKTLHAPSKSPKGLTWDGKYLWCVDDRSDKVIQFSTVDGTTIRSFSSPAKDPKGISFDGKYLWISDRETDEIYMVDPETGYVIIIMSAPGNYVHGLAVDGDRLWAVDFEDDKVYQLKIKDDEKFIKTDKQLHKVTFNHSVTCYGPGKIKTLDVFVALPADRVNQTILNDITYNRKPDEVITDRWGQKAAHFKFSALKPGTKTDVKVTTVLESYNVRYFIYPEKVGSLEDIPDC